MRYLEDFQEGQRITFGEQRITKDDVVNFAQQFDPQIFHLDENSPKTEELGGLMARLAQCGAVYAPRRRFLPR